MEGIFLSIINLSITASYLILCVLLLRLIFKKTPRWIICALWALVGVRLVFPFSLESVISLIPSAKTFDPDIIYSTAPAITSGIPIVDYAVNPIISGNLAPSAPESPKPMLTLTSIASVVWIAGLVLILLYGLLSYIHVRRRVTGAVLLDGNVWQSEGAPSPFILGLVRPKIYIPFGMDSESRRYVIAHENAHLKRFDHLIKPLGFCLLAIYWFNPLVWIAYVLLCRDIELACDEKVVREMDDADRKAYATALLSCGVGRRRIAACPLAFGEVGVKERVRSVMNYKKPAFWIIIVALVACVGTAVFFMTDPKDSDPDAVQEKTVFGTNDFDKATLVGAGTDFDGQVSVFVKDISVRSEEPHLDIKLKNNSGRELIHGSPYSIYYISGDEKIDCDPYAADRAWTSIAYALKSGGSKDAGYKMDVHDLSKAGRYRFELKFSLGDDSEAEYTAWVEFEIENDLPAICVTAYEYVGTSNEAVFTGTKYFEILPGSKCELKDFPGELSFEIAALEGNTAKIRLSQTLELDGAPTNEFALSTDSAVTLLTPETGGGVKYVFEITDMPESELNSAGAGGQVIYRNIPTYEELSETSSLETAPLYVRYFSNVSSKFYDSVAANADYVLGTQLPTVVIDSYEKYVSLIPESMKEYFAEFSDTITDEFFKDKTLIVFSGGSGYSGPTMEIREIMITPDKFYVTADEIASAGNTISSSMGGFIAVDNSLIESCTVFKTYFGTRIYVDNEVRTDHNEDDHVGVRYIRTHSASPGLSYNDPELWSLSEDPDLCDIAAQPIIYKVDNAEEMLELKASLSKFFAIKDRYVINGYEAEPSFDETARYTDSFYEKNAIFVIFDPGTSSENRYLIDSVTKKDGELTIRYSTLLSDKDNMGANRFILVSVDRRYVGDCTEFTAERGYMFPSSVDGVHLRYGSDQYIILTSDTEALVHMNCTDLGFARYTYVQSGDEMIMTSVDDPKKTLTFEVIESDLKYVESSGYGYSQERTFFGQHFYNTIGSSLFEVDYAP